MCRNFLKCLAALDVVSQKAGADNFKNIKSSMNTIIMILPVLSGDIIDFLSIILEVENYIKKDFVCDSHFGSNIPAQDMVYKCHCPYFCFGKKDCSVVDIPENASECNHSHSQLCEDCQIMSIFLDKFNNITDQLQCHLLDTNKPNVDEALFSNSNKIYNQLIYQKDLYMHYIGHKARLTHESKRREINQRRCMLDANLFLVTCDYAMKFLSYKYRKRNQNGLEKRSCLAWMLANLV